MPEMMIDFDVYCSCGEGLCNQTTVSQDYRGNISIKVEPCERCLARARNEGEDVGYNRGYDEGYDKGIEE
jgi:hypothetical protein